MPTDQDGDELTASALAAGTGDRVAVAGFVRGSQRDVWRFVAHLTGVGVADELTRETYLRAIPGLARFGGRCSARTWLLRIARRVVADHLRTGRTARSGDRPGPTDPGFAELVELTELLGTLDPQRREALVLTQVLGLTYAEAAEVCRCPVGAVRTRVARAREDLVRCADTHRRNGTG